VRLEAREVRRLPLVHNLRPTNGVGEDEVGEVKILLGIGRLLRLGQHVGTIGVGLSYSHTNTQLGIAAAVVTRDNVGEVQRPPSMIRDGLARDRANCSAMTVMSAVLTTIHGIGTEPRTGIVMVVGVGAVSRHW
jgi:hypothetical protein